MVKRVNNKSHKVPEHLKQWLKEVQAVKKEAKRRGLVITHKQALEEAHRLRKYGGSFFDDFLDTAKKVGKTASTFAPLLAFL